MARKLCMSVVCDLPPKIVEVALPDGSTASFGSCPLCGFTPERLILGERRPVRGRWLLPAHLVDEVEGARQLTCEEVTSCLNESPAGVQEYAHQRSSRYEAKAQDG